MCTVGQFAVLADEVSEHLKASYHEGSVLLSREAVAK